MQLQCIHGFIGICVSCGNIWLPDIEVANLLEQSKTPIKCPCCDNLSVVGYDGASLKNHISNSAALLMMVHEDPVLGPQVYQWLQQRGIVQGE